MRFLTKKIDKLLSLKILDESITIRNNGMNISTLSGLK